MGDAREKDAREKDEREKDEREKDAREKDARLVSDALWVSANEPPMAHVSGLITGIIARLHLAAMCHLGQRYQVVGHLVVRTTTVSMMSTMNFGEKDEREKDAREKDAR